MKCKKCGEKLAKTDSFCQTCGEIPPNKRGLREETQDNTVLEDSTVLNEEKGDIATSGLDTKADLQLGETEPAVEGVNALRENTVEGEMPTGKETVPYSEKAVEVVPVEQATNALDKVGFGRYLCFLLLNLIPLVGFLIILVCAIASKNRNFKNFCKALIIADIVVLIIAIVIGAFIGGAVYGEYYDLTFWN